MKSNIDHLSWNENLYPVFSIRSFGEIYEIQSRNVIFFKNYDKFIKQLKIKTNPNRTTF